MSIESPDQIAAPIVKHRATANPVPMPLATKAILAGENIAKSADIAADIKSESTPKAVQRSRAESRTLVNDSGVAIRPVIVKERDGTEAIKEVDTKKPEIKTDAAKEPVKAEDTKEEPVTQEKLGKRFAALAKQERILRDKETALKQYENVVKEMSEAKTNAKKSPTKFIQTYGITLDDIINEQLGLTKEVSPEEKLQASIDAKVAEKVKPYLDEIEKDKATAKEEATNKQVSNFKNNYLSPFIETNSSDYDMMITEYGDTAHEELYKVITERLRTKPRIFNTPEETEAFIKETANEIEAQLVLRQEQTLERLQQSKKFGSRLAAKPLDTDTDQTVKLGSRTLTNRLSAIDAAPQQSNRRLTRSESLKRAAATLQQELDRNKK